ncbi:MAG TPA: ATP-binding protein [Stellaceae bacterium]|nr:ATP-binding protein [Stellaceae bacterium]
MRPKSVRSPRKSGNPAESAAPVAGISDYFPLFFAHCPLPLFVYDWERSDIVLVNDAALAQYGYTREEFLGLRLNDLLTEPEIGQAKINRSSTVLKGEERRHRKADGSSFAVDVIRHCCTINGRTLALVICSDATARLSREAELIETSEALRRSHDNLARAQRISGTGSVERDFEARRTVWSQETYRIFGVDPATFVPSPEAMLTFVHPEDRQRVAEALRKSAEGLPVKLEYRIIRPDGAERVIYREAEVILDESGKPRRSVSTLRDRTWAHEQGLRQKRLEIELRVAKDEAEALMREVQAANVDLERRVEERTAELRSVQADLVRATRLSTLGQLTATVAHELRNPLSAIRNSIFAVGEIAASRGIDLDRPLQRIQRSIDRCNNLVSDLLDYSRTRELVLKAQPIDDWLGEVMAELGAPNGVAVELDLKAGRDQARIDAERLRQVVINLHENAMQAMEATPGPRLAVRTRAERQQIEIIFDDNGPGIAPEHLGKVFEPLFSTRPFGTGLGLATVKQIVEQHGGSIELASTLGRGTRAIIRLPAAIAQQAA